MSEKNESTPGGQVIKIDRARIRDYLGDLVRRVVKETLNAILNAKADEVCIGGLSTI